MRLYERVIITSLQFAEVARPLTVDVRHPLTANVRLVVASVYEHGELALRLNGRDEDPVRAEHQESINSVDTALEHTASSAELVQAARAFVRAMTAASLVDAHDPLIGYWYSTVRVVRGSLVRY